MNIVKDLSKLAEEKAEAFTKSIMERKEFKKFDAMSMKCVEILIRNSFLKGYTEAFKDANSIIRDMFFHP